MVGKRNELEPKVLITYLLEWMFYRYRCLNEGRFAFDMSKLPIPIFYLSMYMSTSKGGSVIIQMKLLKDSISLQRFDGY
jgi:hypothetical protein